MPRNRISLIPAVVIAALVLWPGRMAHAQSGGTLPPVDSTVTIEVAFGSGRTAGLRTFTLKRQQDGFVIERETTTRYEHLQETPQQWSIASERVDSIFVALRQGDFSGMPEVLEAQAEVYDCWGWSLTVGRGEQSHRVYVPCTASVPSPLVEVARAFAAVGAEPLGLWGVDL